MARHPHPDPLRFRRRILLGVWLLSGAAVLARAGQVQVVQGSAWEEVALGQQRTAREIPASRGRILDREGVPLAETRELFEVGVAPGEVREGDAQAVRTALQEALGLSASRARAVVESRKSWEHLGVFTPEVQSELRGLRGVYLTRQLRRDYPQGRMALGVLGAARDGVGAGGVEEAFDAHLRGRPGRAVLAKDPSGRVQGGQVFQMEAPLAGGDLTLTLDADLQAIAKEALMAAVDSTEATGGDLLVTDPHTGEILAAVSVKNGVDAGVSFITEPVEPGSTIKPFILATLLGRGRASLDDQVDVGNGTWTQCGGRVVHDVSARGVMTLARAVQVSSNVAMAMTVTEELTAVEEWEGLRDFGFGELSGIAIPGESPGVLRRPEQWTCPSQASHAIGYELSATPLQMAMAYGALANGGLLMEPRLVKEVRHPDGRVEAVEPRVVRRVVRERVAREITQVLVGVVDEGTGATAGLASFTVAGKSGTARAYVRGDYERNRYFSSFVGYFPAEDPQLVIYAKLDEAEGYGGALAGPVTRATMEAALAARGTPIHLESLPRLTRTRQGAGPAVRFASTTDAPPPPAPRTDPSTLAAAWAPERPILEVQVPDLSGLPLREASRVLHTLGLRVKVQGTGRVQATRPASGALVLTGDTILLRSGRAER